MRQVDRIIFQTKNAKTYCRNFFSFLKRMYLHVTKYLILFSTSRYIFCNLYKLITVTSMYCIFWNQILSAGHTLNDDRWHTVFIKRRMQTVEMAIDQDRPVTGVQPEFFVFLCQSPHINFLYKLAVSFFSVVNIQLFNVQVVVSEFCFVF